MSPFLPSVLTCQPIQSAQEPLDAHVIELVRKWMAEFIGGNGRTMLRVLVEQELETHAENPEPEMGEFTAHLTALNTEIDSVIDLAASSPENSDLLTDRLGRLRTEKEEIERRLAELADAPARTFDAEAAVDTVLADLKEAGRLFEHGAMEERKRVGRAFVEGLTIDGASQSGEIQMKRLPTPEMPGTGSSFQVVAGVRYEVQERTSGRGMEVVRARLAVRGGALVPAGRGRPGRHGTRQGARRRQVDPGPRLPGDQRRGRKAEAQEAEEIESGQDPVRQREQRNAQHREGALEYNGV